MSMRNKKNGKQTLEISKWVKKMVSLFFFNTLDCARECKKFLYLQRKHAQRRAVQVELNRIMGNKVLKHKKAEKQTFENSI